MVDAFCIDQSDATDKQIIVAAMSAIYSCAYLTIVAAAGEDAQAGLNRLDEHPFSEESQFHPPLSCSEDVAILPAKPTVDQMIVDTKWDSRAWTYQEHLLSQRCVFFTDDEVIFQCTKEDFREAYSMVGMAKHSRGSTKTHNGKRTNIQHHLNSPTKLGFQHYAELVHSFTNRDLTYDGGRLEPFGAILEKFSVTTRRLMEGNTESGIPVAMMSEALFWNFPWTQNEKHNSRVPYDTRRSRFLPSWSWVGWTGKVSMRHETSTKDSNSRFELMDENNIIAFPIDPCEIWREWPSIPKPCRPAERGCVTIHL